MKFPEYKGIVRHKKIDDRLIILSFWYKNFYIKIFKQGIREWELHSTREIAGLEKANRIFGQIK